MSKTKNKLNLLVTPSVVDYKAVGPAVAAYKLVGKLVGLVAASLVAMLLMACSQNSGEALKKPTDVATRASHIQADHIQSGHIQDGRLVHVKWLEDLPLRSVLDQRQIEEYRPESVNAIATWYCYNWQLKFRGRADVEPGVQLQIDRLSQHWARNNTKTVEIKNPHPTELNLRLGWHEAVSTTVPEACYAAYADEFKIFVTAPGQVQQELPPEKTLHLKAHETKVLQLYSPLWHPCASVARVEYQVLQDTSQDQRPPQQNPADSSQSGATQNDTQNQTESVHNQTESAQSQTEVVKDQSIKIEADKTAADKTTTLVKQAATGDCLVRHDKFTATGFDLGLWAQSMGGPHNQLRQTLLRPTKLQFQMTFIPSLSVREPDTNFYFVDLIKRYNLLKSER